MTAYILTPEQHAQLLKALTTRDLRLHEKCEAMLKAMQPVEPTFYMSKRQSKPRFYREGETLPTNVVSLYAKEQQ